MGSPVSLVAVAGREAFEDAFKVPASNEDAFARVVRMPAPVAASATTASPDAPPSDPAVMTIEELADFLRVNHKTVREAIARGEIPGVRRIGGTIRIFRPAVVDWLSAGQGRAPGSRKHR